MKRLTANQELVKILDLLVQNNPELRFSQILAAFGFIQEDLNDPNTGPLWVNEFNTEPEKILERVNLRLQGMKT